MRKWIILLLFCLCATLSHADWDKDLPSGSKAANLLDDDIRANNAALETAFTEEHVFDTAGTQTGKHSFAVEDTATRTADTDYVAGSVSISTDEISGEYVFMFTDDGTTWHTPIDAFLNNSNDWVNAQYVTPTALTPGATINSTLLDGNVFTVTLDQDSTLANPTIGAALTDKSSVWYYIITQDDPARTLTFGSKFYSRWESGAGEQAELTISTEVDSVNVYQCILDPSGNLQTTYLNRPLIPDDDTAAAGYFEIRDLSSGSTLLFQWIKDADCDNAEDFDFATAFADTNYAVVGTSNVITGVQRFEVRIIDEDTVRTYADAGNNICSIIAIGQKP